MGPRGFCVVEGCSNLQGKNRASYQPKCDRHMRKANQAPSSRTKNAKAKLDYCEECGPDVHYEACQLDLDHKDGDRTNDAPENRQTLCANCYRLKSWKERQGIESKRQYRANRRMERHGGLNG